MSAPVKQTCPDINRVIKWVKSAMSEAKAGMDYDEATDDIKYSFNEIISQLEGVEDMLEDLRSANSSLRDWGDDCEAEIEQLKEEIADLENKFEETA